MKFLMAKIRKKRMSGHCHFTYPERWDANKISVLAYEDHPDNLGDVVEECLCVTDDETAAWLLEQPEVREVSVAEANVFGRQWRPARAMITDETKVVDIIRRLLSKPGARPALRNYLTQQEIDGLDEDNPEPGIGKGKEFNVNEFI